SRAEFCKAHHINLSTFQRWIRRYSLHVVQPKSSLQQNQWESLLKEWMLTDLSQAEFCRQRKIHRLTFVYWKKMLYPDYKQRPLKKQWEPIIREWQDSGVTMRQFCQERGLAPATFLYWKRLLLP